MRASKALPENKGYNDIGSARWEYQYVQICAMQKAITDSCSIFLMLCQIKSKEENKCSGGKEL